MEQQRSTYLFRLWVTGAATDSERSEWLSFVDDPRNEVLVRQLIDGYLQEQKNEEPVSTQTTFHLLNTILGKGPSSSGRSWWRITAAAAILAFVIAGGILFRTKLEPKASAVGIRAVKDAGPGTDRAILTLGDGSRVTLDSTSHHVFQQSGILLSQQDGKLSYQGEANGEISYNTLTTPKGCQYSITLPDSTRVWLNAASSLRYPVAFTGTDRIVELNGEAYFEVANNKAKPFSIRAGNTTVHVLGTHFNVMAYDDEEATKTTLLEGAVKVTSGAVARQITPGQQATVTHTTGELKTGAGNIEEAVAWKDGQFLFQGADLPVLLRQFGRWYNIGVVYKGQQRSYEFVGKIPRTAHLSSILRLFEANDIHYTFENHQLTIEP